MCFFRFVRCTDKFGCHCIDDLNSYSTSFAAMDDVPFSVSQSFFNVKKQVNFFFF